MMDGRTDGWMDDPMTMDNYTPVLLFFARWVNFMMRNANTVRYAC